MDEVRSHRKRRAGHLREPLRHAARPLHQGLPGQRDGPGMGRPRSRLRLSVQRRAEPQRPGDQGTAAAHDRPAGARGAAAGRPAQDQQADGGRRKARPPRQARNDGGQPAPGDLDREEVHQPRPAIPRPDPGRQYRPAEGGGQVRIPPRLQVLDLRDLVDPPGDHAFDRRHGAHHPRAGAHDRDDQQDEPHLAPDHAGNRQRAGPGDPGAKMEMPETRSARS